MISIQYKSDKGTLQGAYMTSDTRTSWQVKVLRPYQSWKAKWEDLKILVGQQKEDYGMNYKSNSDVHNWKSHTCDNTEYYNNQSEV